MTDVIMPQMGESIAEGTLTRWMKKVGDRVQRDEPLFEISTDKVDAEIPAPAAGVLKEIRVEPGTTVPINTVVGVIAPEGEAVATPPAPQASTAPAPAPAAAAPPQPPQPPPAAAPAPTPSAPVAASPASKQPQADGTPGPPPAPTPPPAPGASAAPAPPRPGRRRARRLGAERPRGEMSVDELRQTRSSPVVRKIAAEHNVDIREIPGTGISGRVTKQDILSHLEARPGRRRPRAGRAARGPRPAARGASAAPAAAPAPARRLPSRRHPRRRRPRRRPRPRP